MSSQIETAKEWSKVEEEDTSIEYRENYCHLCSDNSNCVEELSEHSKTNHQERYQNVFEDAFFYHNKKLVETK
jgi:hypothetical protein